jgi:hypothetical protein
MLKEVGGASARRLAAGINARAKVSNHPDGTKRDAYFIVDRASDSVTDREIARIGYPWPASSNRGDGQQLYTITCRDPTKIWATQKYGLPRLILDLLEVPQMKGRKSSAKNPDRPKKPSVNGFEKEFSRKELT